MLKKNVVSTGPITSSSSLRRRPPGSLRYFYSFFRLLFVCILFSFAGCAYHQIIPHEETLTVYKLNDASDNLISRFSPAFLIHDFEKNYNRIGKPSAKKESDGESSVYVDTNTPTFYTMKRPMSINGKEYTNLVYRVHFPKVPFSLFPFFLTAGENVGLMVVITLDENQDPVLVTTVHTCGCYLAIIPTTFLPETALPENWPEGDGKLTVFGESLPKLLDYRKSPHPELLAHIRPGVHRVMDLSIMDKEELSAVNPEFHIISAAEAPLNSLENIRLNGGSTSFYHQDGILKGHVKGSIKLWETILMSAISLDLFVGTDKAYADTQKTDNPFYTSLKPWNRDESNMWYFDRFLGFWGWRLK